MAMVAADLATAIQAQLGTPAPGSGTAQADFALALATAIVNYLKSNLQVASNGTVTSGAGAGGSVTTASTTVT